MSAMERHWFHLHAKHNRISCLTWKEREGAGREYMEKNSIHFQDVPAYTKLLMHLFSVLPLHHYSFVALNTSEDDLSV